MAGYYNKDKDYSKELMRTDLSAGERAQLTQERQNKIDAVYGGKEPTLVPGEPKRKLPAGKARRDSAESAGRQPSVS